ncbi:Lrp/AsnC family transcriptional regulator [Nocardioides gilvus]|uniref:Lrp/AsnC family transcriptional regulator n=1 Tax=Nocardioides gilvus TaxID=1735589 RepID=UPI000D746128|nr:Lrp/AsnC family transcriptional regulator [Nocardioides gilvus]
MAASDIDSVDRQILDLLIENGRRTVKEVADLVGLSPSPVRRRIERLERVGIIAGYTAVVDESRLGNTFEAFAELRFAGNTKVAEITASARSIPEVIGVYTVAGDPDAIVHFKVNSVQHLHQLIDLIRRDGHVIGTKTLMVLDSWQRGKQVG